MVKTYPNNNLEKCFINIKYVSMNEPLLVHFWYIFIFYPRIIHDICQMYLAEIWVEYWNLALLLYYNALLTRHACWKSGRAKIQLIRCFGSSAILLKVWSSYLQYIWKCASYNMSTHSDALYMNTIKYCTIILHVLSHKAIHNKQVAFNIHVRSCSICNLLVVYSFMSQ